MRKFLRGGEPFIWLTGGALAVSIVMIVGLIAVILVNALGYFWPSPVERISLQDGTAVLGIITSREQIPEAKGASRLQVNAGNRDLGAPDFRWIDERQISGRERPAGATLLERREWGPFFGVLEEIREGDRVIARGDAVWTALDPLVREAARTWGEIRSIERDDIGLISQAQEAARLAIRRVEITRGRGGPGAAEEIAAHERTIRRASEDYQKLTGRIAELRTKLGRHQLLLSTADGARHPLPVSTVVRAFRPNALGIGGKLSIYLGRIWEFLWDDPRESNTEGGVFPAIFGTVMMVFLMTLAVVPLGVIAALYLREYAKQGPLVRAVRIAVNNLAGVPSIVFGVFGLGFFVYFIGGGIDRLFYAEALPTPTYGTGGILWAALTLALLTVPVVIVATEEGLAAVPRDIRDGSIALGATKFETTWKIVIPTAMPGILTGMILAMARAAGEVAPLMITGVVKLAPTLPVDGQFPFVHFERKFMHLGFHIYDVGFQSPNVEAARPMVFMTTLLLLLIVVLLNLVAIVVRNRLRKKYRSSTF